MDFSAYRSTFPITAEYAFLNHAAISPYNTRITEAVAAHTRVMLRSTGSIFSCSLWLLPSQRLMGCGAGGFRSQSS